jgi:hypothetical protein
MAIQRGKRNLPDMVGLAALVKGDIVPKPDGIIVSDLPLKPLPACARALSILAIFSLWACADPVHDQEVAALGPEKSGVRTGPLHRPGQPCVLCHQLGSDDPFTVAGTVYATPDKTVPLTMVKVQLVDSQGSRLATFTNCAGNFFVRPFEWKFQYPIWVTLAAEDQLIDMESPIYRDGSCATCHVDPKNPTSAGHVFLLGDETDTLPAGYYCR